MKPNKAGRFAEDVLAAVISNVGGIVFDRQVTIGETIYGRSLRVDFVLWNVPEFPAGLIVESKWQDRDGSVDEKFPYLVANLKQQSIPAVVVVHGGGCREDAMRWLIAQRDKRLVHVFTLEEFVSWIHRNSTQSSAREVVSLTAK